MKGEGWSIKALIPAGFLSESESDVDEEPLTSAMRSEMNLLVASREVEGGEGFLDEEGGREGVLKVSAEL